MNIAVIALALGCLASVLGEECPLSCTCSGGDTITARCTRLALDMYFPEKVINLVVESVPGLQINLTKSFFKNIGLHRVHSIKITNCSISYIDADAFQDLPELTDVNLSDNGLILIHPDTFESNDRLERLTLSGNPLQLTQLLKAEENYFLKSTSLLELDLSRCELGDVGTKLLAQLQNLQYINLKQNNIKVLDVNIFGNTPFLDEIDLSDNLLITLNDEIFEDIEDLTTLILKNNMIDNFEDLEMPGLKELDISYNNIKLLSKTTFQGVPDLSSLNISHNAITWISEETFNELVELRNLDLSYNALRGPLPKFIFEENEYLETLSLAGNKEMKIFEGFSTELPKLYHLDISDCGISNIINSSFSGMPSLAILNISMNALTTLNHMIMAKLHRLNVLDLSYNEITKLGTYTFASNSHLSKLNLAYNQIHHLLPDTFETTPLLSHLDISHNQFPQIWHINESNYMKENGILKELHYLNIAGNKIRELHKHGFIHLINLKAINILDNPLECTSEFPAFIEWLYKNHIQPLHYTDRTDLEELNLEKHNLQWDELLTDICKEDRIEIKTKPVNEDLNQERKHDLNIYQYTVYEDVKLREAKEEQREAEEEKAKLEEELSNYVWPTFLVVFSVVFLTLAIGNTVALLIYRSRNQYATTGFKTALTSPFRRTTVKIDSTPRYHKLYEECSAPIVKGNFIGNLVNSQIKGAVLKPKNDDVV